MSSQLFYICNYPIRVKKIYHKEFLSRQAAPFLIDRGVCKPVMVHPLRRKNELLKNERASSIKNPLGCACFLEARTKLFVRIIGEINLDANREGLR